MAKRKLVIGLGSGRTGTTSLAAFIDAQPNTLCTHEAHPIPWKVSIPDLNKTLPSFVARYRKLEKDLREKGIESEAIIGDVAFYHIPYVIFYLKAFKVKFVCLKRPREEVVKSFLGHTDRHQQGHNFWSKTDDHVKSHYNDFTKWVHSIWNECFPKYDGKNRKECLEQYWDEYYKIAEVCEILMPANFKIFPTTHLKTIEGQKEILRFLGYKKGNLFPDGVIVKNHNGQENKNTPANFETVTL